MNTTIKDLFRKSQLLEYKLLGILLLIYLVFFFIGVFANIKGLFDIHITFWIKVVIISIFISVWIVLYFISNKIGVKNVDSSKEKVSNYRKSAHIRMINWTFAGFLFAIGMLLTSDLIFTAAYVISLVMIVNHTPSYKKMQKKLDISDSELTQLSL